MKKNPKPEQDDVIMVWWRDANSLPSWTPKDQPCNLTSVISVGFYNGFHKDETGEYLSIYATRDIGNGNAAEMTAIPAGCVVKMRVLEKSSTE